MTLSLNAQLVSGRLYIDIGYYRNNSFISVRYKLFQTIETDFTTHTVTALIPADLQDTDILSVRFYTQTGGEVLLAWAKLEMGQVATAFTPPNLAEELSKCQRYYLDTCYQVKNTLSPYGIGSGFCYATGFAYFVCSLPTTMRILSEQITLVKDLTKLVVLCNKTTIPITALDIVGSNDTCVTIRATGNFAEHLEQPAILRVISGENNLGILAFDAEI